MNAETDLVPISIPAADDQSSAQDSLYRKAASSYGAALSRLVNAYEVHVERRKDLLQDIHVALWRSLANFNRECSLRTWVYRVAHNTAATHVLRDKRQRSSQWVTLEQLEELPADTNDERSIDEAAVLQRLNKLIHGLKPIDRDVILLYLEEVEAIEIAAIVGLSASNVAQKIHRIKKVLQRHFEDGDSHDSK